MSSFLINLLHKNSHFLVQYVTKDRGLSIGMLWKLQAVQNLFEDSCELPMLTGEQESATINMD